MTTKKNSSMKRLQQFAEEQIEHSKQHLVDPSIPVAKSKRDKMMFAAGQLSIALFIKGFTLGVK